jgi:hypothetical protein
MMIPVGSFTSAAAGSAHPAILLRRRPADSRRAACRIIRGGDADGAISERVAFEIGDPSSLEYFIAMIAEMDRMGARFGLGWNGNFAILAKQPRNSVRQTSGSY